MWLKFIWSLALLQLINARVAPIPKFYGQDSAIIVDTDRKLPMRMDTKLQNALYYNIPVYKLIKPVIGPTTTTTTTTTKAPVVSVLEYPSDLLYIARHKLGMKELPSLSDLGEMLGTSSAQETIDYIRSLTSNEQGIALMKQYLESLDYSEAEEARNDTNDDGDDDDDAADDDGNNMDNADIEADYDEDQPKMEIKSSSSSSTTTTTTTTTTTAAPSVSHVEGSLMQRFGDFMKHYNLWSETTTPAPTTQKPSPPPAVAFKPVFLAPHPRMRPMLVRQPLPYHYPIPLRPAKIPTTTSTIPTTTTSTTTPRPSASPHLNTPKHVEREISEIPAMQFPPHVRQLAQLANISPLVLDRFLQQQPKLAELAKRVSNLPFSEEHSRTIDSQVFVAVKRALAQNDDLKRLLSAAQTLN
ncbi:uncharacterized protein Dwil_GK15969 [Drosophila willistoni]|uniref:DUF4794 domain-containing protein n=2 Tax=Drosophila willistoni TaxID=7260 RepID=B4MS97_DROWI|nr:uncharacterized protein Dwil_GK15969 [Drosophila willistoni]